ncbi:MAG: hypothetical protein U9N81_08870 [Bacillota bacterium]|nr:hypothetical protein [Bacillota bacterium]
MDSNKNLRDLFIEQPDTIPQMLYDVQAHVGIRPAQMFKPQRNWKVLNFTEDSWFRAREVSPSQKM